MRGIPFQNLILSFGSLRRSRFTVSQIKFGTDGWRGVIGRDFTFANVEVVAQAVADYMESQRASFPCGSGGLRLPFHGTAVFPPGRGGACRKWVSSGDSRSSLSYTVRFL